MLFHALIAIIELWSFWNPSLSEAQRALIQISRLKTQECTRVPLKLTLVFIVPPCTHRIVSEGSKAKPHLPMNHSTVKTSIDGSLQHTPALSFGSIRYHDDSHQQQYDNESISQARHLAIASHSLVCTSQERRRWGGQCVETGGCWARNLIASAQYCQSGASRGGIVPPLSRRHYACAHERWRGSDGRNIHN